MVAPSEALPKTVETSELELPAGQDQVVPLPLHAACAGIAQSIQIRPATQAIRGVIVQLRGHSWCAPAGVPARFIVVGNEQPGTESALEEAGLL